ncbi:hypothetical protein [Streptomyces griseofuscus]|uniref:hypothetical protein n=1 Tax=Streptomyces griseofuscus TaxID=146922 RepID=UPI00381745D8
MPDESPAGHAARRARDAQVVEFLRGQGFAGPRYEKFTGQLMEYSWPVMLGWAHTGEIFRQARKNGCPVPASLLVPAWTQDDRYEVVTDSLLHGLASFRANALQGGRWDPGKGASVTTYYVRACIFAFRTVYEAWSRRYCWRASTVQTCAGLDDDPLAQLPDGHAADPCHIAVVNDDIRRVLPMLPDGELRAAVVRRAAGFTQDEAAGLMGMTGKALESRLGRVRLRIREQYSEGGTR